MAYKFQVGEARLSGSLVREGDVLFKDSSAASSIIMEVEEDGDVNIQQHNGSDTGLKLADALVTSTAAELNLVDGSSAATVVASKAVIYGGSGQILGASVYINDNGYVGNSSVNDLIQLQDDGDIIIKNGEYDFDIASHDGTNGLLLGGVLVAASAAELNLVDGSQASTVVNSKALIYGSSGEVVGTSFVVADDSYVGAVGDTDMLQFDAGNDLTLASDLDFIIGKAGGLQLADGAVNSTAAELNLLDGSGAGSVVNSKGVIYSAGGQVNGTSLSSSTGITGSSLQMGDYGLTNAGALAISAMNANWTNANRTVADLGSITTVDINGGSLDGVIIGAASAAAATVTSLSVSDGNITNVGDIALDSISADGSQIDLEMTDNTAEAFKIFESGNDFLVFDTTDGSELMTIGMGWTAGSQTCTDLGSVTTADINGGSLDGVVIGAASAAAATVTSLVANGNVDLGDATSDTITATGRFDSALVPSSDSARDLGTSALRWSTIYVDSIVGADIAADTEKYGAAPLGYTLSASVDFALLSTAAQTYTLPAASAGKKLDIKLSGSIHTCTIVAASNDSIEGGETIILESTGSAISLVAMDATHWFIV